MALEQKKTPHLVAGEAGIPGKRTRTNTAMPSMEVTVYTGNGSGCWIYRMILRYGWIGA
jgi:hypothetical protein